MTTPVELDSLIDELTVDANGDEDRLSGLHVGAEGAIARGERGRSWELTSKSWRSTAVPACAPVCSPVSAATGLCMWSRLADLGFSAGRQLGLVVVAYRRWLGR
jgi:hypothetical protein